MIDPAARFTGLAFCQHPRSGGMLVIVYANNFVKKGTQTRVVNIPTRPGTFVPPTFTTPVRPTPVITTPEITLPPLTEPQQKMMGRKESTNFEEQNRLRTFPRAVALTIRDQIKQFDSSGNVLLQEDGTRLSTNEGAEA